MLVVAMTACTAAAIGNLFIRSSVPCSRLVVDGAAPAFLYIRTASVSSQCIAAASVNFEEQMCDLTS
jgi:hypothetical protein